MKVLLVLFASAFFINVNAQKMKEYKIEIAVKAGVQITARGHGYTQTGHLKKKPLYGERIAQRYLSPKSDPRLF